MIEEDPHAEDDEFEFQPWDQERKKPAHWDHEPKRGIKKGKKDETHKSEKSGGQEDKRKNKIEDKIFRKVVAETDDHAGKIQTGPVQGVKVDR
jgi:hypothetical protein